MTDTAKSWIYPAIIVVLLLIIAGMAYKFIVVGSTEKTEDGRVSVLLEPGERELMLREMRAFVAGLQLMSDALSRDDMKGVAKFAREMGTAKAHDVPLAMMGKLPLRVQNPRFQRPWWIRHHRDRCRNNRHAQAYPGQLSEVLQNALHATTAIR